MNTYTTGIQGGPDVARDAAGDFVVVWTSDGSPGTDKSGFSVQGQREGPGRILGKKLAVRDPTGAEQRRSVLVLGKETTTDIGPMILGDPTVSGATLRIVASGGTSSDESYVLDAAGWTALPTGFRYVGPTGGDGDPVKRVILKRTPRGIAMVKAVLAGSVGTQSLAVVPPNPGDAGGLELDINGGMTYCVAFGGAAGGTEARDTATQWRVVDATAQACP